jgi:nucleoside-diphosphate-sugar epimerase
MDLSSRLGGQKILITGASGFLGSHLSRRLRQIGCEVHAISRREHSAEDGLRWWQGDFADLGTARKLLLAIKPDVLFHLSGLVTASPDLQFVLPTFQTLLVSTINTLMEANAIGCRVVLVASLTEPEPGKTDPTPGSPYAAAKWASSAYGRMFHKLYGTPVVVVRPFMTYGPGQNIRKLIPYVIHTLLQNEILRISSGDWQADWIYIDDVIDGFLAAAYVSGIEGDTIDLGSGTLTPIRGVVQQILKLVGSKTDPEYGALPDRPFEQVRAANLSDAYSKLAWKPTTPLEKGLALTIDWYRRERGNPATMVF